MVESLPVKEFVVGSNPTHGANFIIKIICICEFFFSRKKEVQKIYFKWFESTPGSP